MILTGSLEDLTLAVDEAATEAHRRLRSEARRAAPSAQSRRDRDLTRVSGDNDGDMTRYRIGIDVGGTFTDLICVTPSARWCSTRRRSTLDDQSLGVMIGLEQLADALRDDARPTSVGQIDLIVHGTTTADNTMIEQDGAAVGLLVTEGHRDEIEMRRVHKEQIWDPSYPAPFPIARRRARIPIAERLDFEGDELRPLDEDAVRAGIDRLRRLGCDSLAVMFLSPSSTRPTSCRARELILEEWPEVGHISLSPRGDAAKGPEFERMSTTLVNAYVAPRISRYLSPPRRAARATPGYDGELLVMASTGGVMPPSYVARRAVTLLGSGPDRRRHGRGPLPRPPPTRPTSSRSTWAAPASTSAWSATGGPRCRADWNWRYRYYIGMPMVDVQCVGAGGGSIARVRQGALLVGPESAGSDPGPCCYGARRRPPDGHRCRRGARLPAGRRVRRRTHAPRRRGVARGHRPPTSPSPLGIDDLADAAWGIERIVNANMANATRGSWPRRASTPASWR